MEVPFDSTEHAHIRALAEQLILAPEDPRAFNSLSVAWMKQWKHPHARNGCWNGLHNEMSQNFYCGLLTAEQMHDFSVRAYGHPSSSFTPGTYKCSDRINSAYPRLDNQYQLTESGYGPPFSHDEKLTNEAESGRQYAADISIAPTPTSEINWIGQHLAQQTPISSSSVDPGSAVQSAITTSNGRAASPALDDGDYHPSSRSTPEGEEYQRVTRSRAQYDPYLYVEHVIRSPSLDDEQPIGKLRSTKKSFGNKAIYHDYNSGPSKSQTRDVGTSISSAYIISDDDLSSDEEPVNKRLKNMNSSEDQHSQRVSKAKGNICEGDQVSGVIKLGALISSATESLGKEAKHKQYVIKAMLLLFKSSCELRKTVCAAREPRLKGEFPNFRAPRILAELNVLRGDPNSSLTYAPKNEYHAMLDYIQLAELNQRYGEGRDKWEVPMWQHMRQVLGTARKDEARDWFKDFRRVGESLQAVQNVFGNGALVVLSGATYRTAFRKVKAVQLYQALQHAKDHVGDIFEPVTGMLGNTGPPGEQEWSFDASKQTYKEFLAFKGA